MEGQAQQAVPATALPTAAPAAPQPRQKPGTPSLLRELNDRAALDLLLTAGPLTRAQLSERTGISKVTVSQMLARLEERGLVRVAGEQAGGRGPNAALYSVVPSSAYVAGLYVELDQVSAAVADVAGNRVANVRVDPNGTDDPVGMVRDAISQACESADINLADLSAVVIGSPGVLDPRTGAPRLAVNLPTWHEGVLDGLRNALHTPVVIENDVNLAAMAERADGAAAGLDDFVLVWLGTGLGLATVIGGQVLRGSGGAAGEIGWMPVHGTLLPSGNEHPGKAGLQALAGGWAVQALAMEHGFGGGPASEVVAAAVADATAGGSRGPAFLDEVAHRVAIGVAAVCVVLDPGLVVLGGPVGHAGGSELATRVTAEVPRMCLARPMVVPTTVHGEPVLRGAMQAALAQARAGLLGSLGAEV
jgi:predicted NBD/HSP70 family sugar kinase